MAVITAPPPAPTSPSNGTYWYRCKYCQEKFSTRDKAVVHLRKTHFNEYEILKLASERFSNRERKNSSRSPRRTKSQQTDPQAEPADSRDASKSVAHTIDTDAHTSRCPQDWDLTEANIKEFLQFTPVTPARQLRDDPLIGTSHQELSRVQIQTLGTEERENSSNSLLARECGSCRQQFDTPFSLNLHACAGRSSNMETANLLGWNAAGPFSSPPQINLQTQNIARQQTGGSGSMSGSGVTPRPNTHKPPSELNLLTWAAAMQETQKATQEKASILTAQNLAVHGDAQRQHRPQPQVAQSSPFASEIFSESGFPNIGSTYVAPSVLDLQKLWGQPSYLEQESTHKHSYTTPPATDAGFMTAPTVSTESSEAKTPPRFQPVEERVTSHYQPQEEGRSRAVKASQDAARRQSSASAADSLSPNRTASRLNAYDSEEKAKINMMADILQDMTLSERQICAEMKSLRGKGDIQKFSDDYNLATRIALSRLRHELEEQSHKSKKWEEKAETNAKELSEARNAIENVYAKTEKARADMMEAAQGVETAMLRSVKTSDATNQKRKEAQAKSQAMSNKVVAAGGRKTTKLCGLEFPE